MRNRNEPGRFVKPCSHCLGIQLQYIPVLYTGANQENNCKGRDSVNLAYRIMPVYYGFTQWSYDGETDHAEWGSVMPRISMKTAGSGFAPSESQQFN